MSSLGGDSSVGGGVGSGGVGSGGASSGVNSTGIGGDGASGGAGVGGAATGGTKAAGGAATGGAGVGGAANGGTKAAGGAATGGAGVGGAATGGTKAAGGAGVGGAATGGTKAATGGAGVGGAATGGTKAATGGAGVGGAATGGAATGGTKAAGGAATGGTKAAGGVTSVAGASSTGGATTVNTSTTITDPDCNTPMPTGGTVHTYSSSNYNQTIGGTNPLSWQIWSNGGNPGTLTTFGTTAAFSASWNQSQNYLGRIGYEWGNSGAAYTTHGKITAQFVETRTGSGNFGWSYIGMYGWTTNPCIEWYIVEDSFGTMPANPGSCSNMSNSGMTLDGGKYTMCVRPTTGTGGNRCGSNVTQWNQYYSLRQTSRKCGTISVSDHFKAWADAGNSMAGNLLEVSILVEVGGGQGTVDFPVAIVTAEK